MSLTRGEAQEIYDAVTDVLDGWVAGSDLRNRGGASINEAALPRIRNEIAESLRNHFASKGVQVID